MKGNVPFARSVGHRGNGVNDAVGIGVRRTHGENGVVAEFAEPRGDIRAKVVVEWGRHVLETEEVRRFGKGGMRRYRRDDATADTAARPKLLASTKDRHHDGLRATAGEDTPTGRRYTQQGAGHLDDLTFHESERRKTKGIECVFEDHVAGGAGEYLIDVVATGGVHETEGSRRTPVDIRASPIGHFAKEIFGGSSDEGQGCRFARSTHAARLGLRNVNVERVTGIEPAWPAWKAGALPLSYTRRMANSHSTRSRSVGL